MCWADWKVEAVGELLGDDLGAFHLHPGRLADRHRDRLGPRIARRGGCLSGGVEATRREEEMTGGSEKVQIRFREGSEKVQGSED